MTINAEDLSGTPTKRIRLGHEDPILQELWAVKAAMNAESGYSIAKLAEQAREFDLAATVERLQREVEKH
jgi:hypothetical protein